MLLTRYESKMYPFMLYTAYRRDTSFLRPSSIGRWFARAGGATDFNLVKNQSRTYAKKGKRSSISKRFRNSARTKVD